MFIFRWQLSDDSPRIVTQSQVAPDDMLEETNRARFLDGRDHVAEHCSDGVEALVRLTHICEADVVQEDLLYDENGHCLAELGARLHDSQAQRNDFRGQQEGDYLRIIRLLDQSADDSEGSQAQVLKGPRL